MNLKNYTSEIPAETSIARIEGKLAALGASHIAKMYGPDKRVSGLFFIIKRGEKSYPIRVPANVSLCFETMWKDYTLRTVRPHPEAKERIKDQAERTAWKIVHEWVEIQISMIMMQQAEPLEIFLAYVWDGNQTYFEKMEGGGFKQLPESTTSTQ